MHHQAYSFDFFVVFDLNAFRQNIFQSRCNTASVDLEPVELKEDIEFLKGIITEFLNKTESQVAEKILQDWSVSLKRFVKVRRNIMHPGELLSVNVIYIL